MHDYLLSTEWVRFAFVLGIVVSMLLYERRHLTTGSIVVPGYIAVFLAHPLVLVATFVNAFLTYWLVNDLLRRKFLLYGRTKFTILATISTLIQTLMLHLSPTGRWLWESEIALFAGAGYIVPALVAHDMARQGVSKTIKSVLLAGSLVALPIAVAIAFDIPGANDIAPIDGFGTLSFPPEWIPIAVIVSILSSWAVAHNYGCRSGGFIGAALLGMFLADPWQVAIALVLAAASYLIVAKFLMHHMILFGRRKFSAMLLTSAALAWPTMWFGDLMLSPAAASHFAAGSLALTPLMLPGLIANDVQRTSPRRVAIGLTLAGLTSVTATWWIGSALTGQRLELGWKLITAVSVVILAWPQIVQQIRWAAARAARWSATTRPVLEVTTVRATTARASARRLYAKVVSELSTIARNPATAVDQLFHPPAPARLATASSYAGPARPIDEPWTTESDPTTSWRLWALQHPEAAADAQAWLTEVLAEAPAGQPSTTPTRAFEHLAPQLIGAKQDQTHDLHSCPEPARYRRQSDDAPTDLPVREPAIPPAADTPDPIGSEPTALRESIAP